MQDFLDIPRQHRRLEAIPRAAFNREHLQTESIQYAFIQPPALLRFILETAAMEASISDPQVIITRYFFKEACECDI